MDMVLYHLFSARRWWKGTLKSGLAISGGPPVRRRPFPPWPAHAASDRERIRAVSTASSLTNVRDTSLAGEFAQEFAAYHGAAHGTCTASGSAALTLALRALGVQFGDEVIVPAYCCRLVASSALQAGAVPVFADVDPETYCLDPEAVRAAITSRTRAIVAVHLAMRFADLEALLAIAARTGVAVVEDCAQAHGARYRGRGAGSMAGYGCFSFGSSKLMPAGGGGLILTCNSQLMEELVMLGPRTERPAPAGTNHRVSESQAAVLMEQLERLAEWTERRARNAAQIVQSIEHLEAIRPLPPQVQADPHATYALILRYRPGIPGVTRDQFVRALNAEGIPCMGGFYEPICDSARFRATAREFAQLPQPAAPQPHCPVSRAAAYKEAVWLPHYILTGDSQDAADIAEAIVKVATQLRP